LFRRKRALDKVIRRSFLVTMEDGGVFQGALIEDDDRQFVFAAVRVPQGDEWEPAADAPLYIDRVKVAYMQKLSIHAAQ
jgi:hypothetical protein